MFVHATIHPRQHHTVPFHQFISLITQQNARNIFKRSIQP